MLSFTQFQLQTPNREIEERDWEAAVSYKKVSGPIFAIKTFLHRTAKNKREYSKMLMSPLSQKNKIIQSSVKQNRLCQIQ